MTTIPLRTVQTERQFMNWRQYPNAVHKPAARIFGYSLAATFGLFESVALLALWATDASARDALYWYAIAAMMALAVGGFAGWNSFVALHYDYLDLSPRSELMTSTDHGQLSEQARGIPLNETDQIIIRRPAKTLNGVVFQGAWLEKMYSALQDGNQRLTRETSGISGSSYGDCVRVLRQGGYVDENNEYTEAGKAWLATK